MFLLGVINYTLPETKIVPENQWGPAYFQVRLLLVSGRVIQPFFFVWGGVKTGFDVGPLKSFQGSFDGFANPWDQILSLNMCLSFDIMDIIRHLIA